MSRIYGKQLSASVLHAVGSSEREAKHTLYSFCSEDSTHCFSIVSVTFILISFDHFGLKIFDPSQILTHHVRI